MATVSELVDDVPTPHPPVAMVIPELEPDEEDEYDDEYFEPVPPAPAPTEPEPQAQQPPSQYGDEYRPAPPPYEPPSPAPYTQGFAAAPMPGAPQQFAPAPYAPQAQPAVGSQYGDEYRPAAAATPQHGAGFAPAAPQQPELPPYVPQAALPPDPPQAYGQPPAFGQPPVGYPQAPIGFPQAAPTGYPQNGPGPAWQNNGPQWNAPVETKKSKTKVVLIVLGAVLVALIGVGILSAVALPVLLDQRAKAAASELGLESVTCEQVATYAVEVSAAGKAQDTGPLTSMTDVSVVQDNRSSVRLPSSGDDPTFVLSCAGTGTKPDGTTAPVTANLYIDSDSQQLVAYGWDE